MKKLIIFGIIIFTATACSLFEFKEKKAIEICKNTKIQFSSEDDNFLENLLLNSIGGFALGLNRNATWQDFANLLSENAPNTRFEWKADKTKEAGIYIVSFNDMEGWGHKWEVSLEAQTVKHINQNEFLSRKYGFSQLDRDGNFDITKITEHTMKLERVYNRYSNKYVKNVVCELRASAVNKTGKTLTNAEIEGTLKVIFKDKTIVGNNEWRRGFKSKVSKDKPWLPNTEREFHIKTNGIEEIYLDYLPEYVVFEVNLIAKDPIGFSFNKNIAETDFKNKWKKLKQ